MFCCLFAVRLIHPPNRLGIRLFGKRSSAPLCGSFIQRWQIKGLETVIEPRWANDILSLQWVRVRGTPVGAITLVKAEILVIGPSDRVGGSMGRSGWLLLVSRGAWLWCHQIGTRGAAVVCACTVGIRYKSHALTGSSSFQAAPVTGSLHFYAPVCRLTVCCAAGFSSWVLFGGSDCIRLAVFGLFFRRVGVYCMMVTDSDAAAEGQPSIMFDVTLDVP